METLTLDISTYKDESRIHTMSEIMPSPAESTRLDVSSLPDSA
jgi:hypothetical protein